jgi:hypothetical protein
MPKAKCDLYSSSKAKCDLYSSFPEGSKREGCYYEDINNNQIDRKVTTAGQGRLPKIHF